MPRSLRGGVMSTKYERRSTTYGYSSVGYNGLDMLIELLLLIRVQGEQPEGVTKSMCGGLASPAFGISHSVPCWR